MKELTREQVASFRAKGYIRLEQVYSAEEMSEEMNYVMETLANWNSAWRGAWRKEYMDEAEDETTTLVAIHGLQHYSAPREIDQGQDPRGESVHGEGQCRRDHWQYTKRLHHRS